MNRIAVSFVATLAAALSMLARAELDMTQQIKLAAANPDRQQSVAQLEELVRQADGNADNNYRVYYGALGRAHLARAYANMSRWKDCADTMAESINRYASQTITAYLKTAELVDMLSVERGRCLAGAGQIDEAITELTRLQAKGAKDAEKVLQEVQSFQQSQAAERAKSERTLEVRRKAIQSAEEAAAHGNLGEALGIYAVAMQAGLPENFDTQLPPKAAELVRRMKSFPPVPEEARRHAIYGQTALKSAKDKKDYIEAAKQFSHALALAPWWRDSYLNLGLVFELMEENQTALNLLQAYATLAPPSEAKKVQDKIYELEYKVKRTSR